MSEEGKYIGVNFGFRNVDEVVAEIEGVEGVESTHFASPMCLHEFTVKLAASMDVDTMIEAIAAIVGVDRAIELPSPPTD